MKKFKLVITYNNLYYMIDSYSKTIIYNGTLIHSGNRVTKLNEGLELFYKTNSKGTNCVKKSYRKS